MHEVEALADRASVFRNGRHIETFDKGARIDRRDRATDDRPRHRDAISAKAGATAPRAPALRMREPRLGEPARRHFARRRRRRDRRPRRPRRAGAEDAAAGAVRRAARRRPARSTVNGRAVRTGFAGATPSRGEIGIALVPEDRKTEGLMLPMSIADNLTIASLGALASGPFIDRGKESAAVKPTASSGCASRSARRATRSRRCPAATSRRWSSPNG